MADNDKRGHDPESTFSFAVRELRQARRASEDFGVAAAPLQVVNEDRGVDPYNTSGSFDRKHNWTRVGKR